MQSAHAGAAAAKSLQLCPTLCDPIDSSPLGSPIPGFLQARTLEWVAISFSSAGKGKVKVRSLSRVWLLAIPRTAAYQAPPSMGFSRQEYWSGVPLPSPSQLMRHSHIELSHLPSLLQMPNNLEWSTLSSFGNFLCCKRISFFDPFSCSLSTSDGWPLPSSSSRLLYPLRNFLNQHYNAHSLAVSGPKVLLMLWVVSAALWTILNLKKNIILYNIISLV